MHTGALCKQFNSVYIIKIFNFFNKCNSVTACTVIYNGEPVTSCCILAGQADGADIITLEGVSKDGQPDVVQQAFMDAGAVQCGFCIPGMILTAEAFLKKNPNPTRDEVKLAISGNLCRCTGYAKINDAVLLAAARMRGEEAEA